MSFTLPNTTHMGTVSLTVTDLSRSIAYYERLGLKVHRQEGAVAYLGAGEADLVILHENAAAKVYGRTAGLYHFAILLPSRFHLAKAFKNMIDQQIPVSGYSDHMVSEAIYLSDPDGIGIEIYADRPRSTWQFRANGEMRLETEPLDLQSLLNELRNDSTGWAGFPTGTTLGHVHLHVGNIEEAGAFYTRILGMDLITKYGRSAQFVSAGGYHHHIGMNTWAGEGVVQPPENSVGLRWFSIVLPDEDAQAAVLATLRTHAVSVSMLEGQPLLQDPAGNSILLTTEVAFASQSGEKTAVFS